MHLRLLGAAAGGGFPQWNCACRLCSEARATPDLVPPSRHCSLAVSATGERWYLLGAAPDVREQIESTPDLQAGPGPRDTPIAGVLLCDAELDHTLGLLVLREGATLHIHGTRPVLAALDGPLPIRRLLSDYAKHTWIVVEPGVAFPVDGGRLQATAIALGHKRPRYARELPADEGWVVGYRIVDLVSGGSVLFAPSVEEWTPALEEALDGSTCALLDGTFWTEDEMARSGAGTTPASVMGHLPITGPGGSAARFSRSAAARKIYAHVNNTNPILDRRSPEHAE